MNYSAWTFQAHENAYRLELQNRPAVHPDDLGDQDVLVHVRAVSLNYRDLIAWQNLAGRNVQGRVPASDGAGHVVAVGKQVTQFRVGDRVAGCFFQTWQGGEFEMRHHRNDLGGTLDGMLQQYVVLPETGLVEVPDYLGVEEAATLPCAALTAWYALTTRGNLQPDQTVLVLGTGGVSLFALQFAKALGASVIVTSSDDAKLSRAVELGATHVINYRHVPEWADEVLRLTDGRGVQHVVEVGGPGTLKQSLKAIAAGGHIALIGVLTGFGAPDTSLFPLLAKNVQLNGIYVGSRSDFIRMNAFLSKHQLKPVIDRVFEFGEAPQAFEYLKSARHMGKVVVRVG